MDVTPLPIVTEDKFWQSPKVLSLKTVTLLGIIILYKDVQEENAYDPKVSRFLGKLILFNPNRSLAPILFSNIKILSCPPQSQERLSLVHVSHKT